MLGFLGTANESLLSGMLLTTLSLPRRFSGGWDTEDVRQAARADVCRV